MLFFIAIQRKKSCGLTTGFRWQPCARVITNTFSLNLDNFGAKITKHLRAIGTSNVLR